MDKDLPQISIATADGGNFDDADAPLVWEHSTPKVQGIDSRGLIRAVSRVRGEGVNPCGREHNGSTWLHPV